MIQENAARDEPVRDKTRVQPVSGVMRRGWAALAAVGQILSTLDDRDPLRALRTLEPEREQDEELRCTRCITHGE